MALQNILFLATQEDEARADARDMIAPALRQAFPLPKDDADGRFRALLDALSRRAQTGADRHA